MLLSTKKRVQLIGARAAAEVFSGKAAREGHGEEMSPS